MTNSMKPRLDLDGMERHLTQAQVAGPKADPLAELARIVGGQEDPFHALLASDKAARSARTEPAGLDDLFVAREGQSVQGGSGVPPEGYALQPDMGAGGQSRPSATVSYERHDYHPDYRLAPSHDRSPAPPDDFSRLMEEAAAYEGSPYHGAEAGDAYPAEEDDFQPLQPRRSRKGLIAVGALLGVAALGVSGALMLRGHSGTPAGTEPPVVQADNSPLKIKPRNPGGVEIPDQNKQIYEKGGQEAQTRVVDREEQPIDVRQAARLIAPASEPAASPALPPSAMPPQSDVIAALGEPRRVRTVSVRPDGSFVPADPGAATLPSPGSAPAPTPLPEASAFPAPLSTPFPDATPAPMTSGASPIPATTPASPTATPATPAQVSVLPPQRPRFDPRTTSAMSPATATPARSTATSVSQPEQVPGNGPLQIMPDMARTAPKPSQRLAAAQEPTLAAEADQQTGTISGGGFAVQLAVRDSEADARTTFGKLQERHGDLLGARSPSIQRAEVKGRTVYRVRVGQLSRDEAASLCAKIKSAGGQCFVAKN